MDGYGFPSAAALGLRAPIERTLGTSARLEYLALLAALEEDANALAQAHSREQKEQLGIAGPATPLERAMWDNEPDHVAWKREELERARRLAEWGNAQALAAEVRDQRP